jgi:acyl-CoA synthetase
LLFYGAGLLGAVVVPIVHFYGAKEVRYILERSGARLLVTADRFRTIDYLATLDAFVDDLPALESVVVVGDDPGRWTPFTSLLDGDPLASPAAIDPAAAALVAWTSGTTSDPKGVVHSHRTIVAESRQLAAARSGPPTLIGAPVGHAIGLLGALMVPVIGGDPVHLIDMWDPPAVLAAMLEDKVSAATGATFFLTSLLDHPDFGPEHLDLMRQVSMGGAPVPRAVAERTSALGMSMIRMYGSTEHPSTTGSMHGIDAPEKGLYTDGRPLPGVELRLVDDDGKEVAPGSGVPGEVISRGPDCFEGYTDPALTAAAFTGDGWYVSGDVGVLDEEGYLTITDRKKDIIIRGGENISAAEIEDLVLHLPGVAEAAVVAAPDERMGEHACAFVRVLPGSAEPTLDEMRAHLSAAGLARPKWPEELRVTDDLPRTASGKVQKFVLRERLRGATP